jgi:hypothetical protein
MNNDPADRQAIARSDLGITRLLEQTRQELPHPSLGGTRGYPAWYRVDQIQKWLSAEPVHPAHMLLASFLGTAVSFSAAPMGGTMTFGTSWLPSTSNSYRGDGRALPIMLPLLVSSTVLLLLQDLSLF